MEKNQIIIRKAVETDSEKIWKLMRDLAVFEKYIDVFAITPQIVQESGFHKNPPDFHWLMNALKTEASLNNCNVIKWTVAPWNDAGRRFYERLGAKENTEWINYEWSI